MGHLGIVLDFKTKMVTLDKQTLPMLLNMKNLENPNEWYWILASRYQLTKILYIEPTVTQYATDRAVKNMAANYEAADLPKIPGVVKNLGN